MAPCIHEPIEGLNLNTETGALEALRTVTLEAAAGHIPSEHAKNLMLLIATVINAERGELESKVTVALSQMREVLEGRQVRSA